MYLLRPQQDSDLCLINVNDVLCHTVGCTVIALGFYPNMKARMIGQV